MKSFRGVKTSIVHWHAKPTIEETLENIILHCGTNDIIIHCGTNDISKDEDSEEIATDTINLSKTVRVESRSNVIISDLAPRKRYLNAKVGNVNNRLFDYCRNLMLTFLNHDNINVQIHCKISGLHLKSK